MRRLAVLLTTTLALLPMTGPAAPADAVGTAWVRQAQRQLNALHCDAGPADGRTGAHTRSAVVRLQSRHGMRTNGHLDKATRRLLRSGAAHRCDDRPLPRHSGSGRRVVISQAQNWLWLVGSRGRVVAQAGIVDNPAVLSKGTWHTGSYCGRAARVRLNTSGSLWLDDFVRFAPCGIGFHRIPAGCQPASRSTPTGTSGPTSPVTRTAASACRSTWPSGSGTSPRVVRRP